jgi:SAM-dependent methyltransferase
VSRAFDTAYADGGVPTWDIGRPQPAVVRLVESGAFGDRAASVLDAGCGTGEHALLLAATGHPVVGVDVAAEAVRRAQAKATERTAPGGVAGPAAPRFRVHDALELGPLAWVEGHPFDAALDVGLFHTFSDEQRPRYAASLAMAMRPGGRAFVLCWSDHNPFGFGPRRVTRREIRATFRASAGWRVERIDEEELISRLPGGRVHAWLARLIRRG